MRCDYHIHSSISCDCQAPMEAQVARAETLGLDEICFTEHLEINFHRGEDWRTDIDNYSRRIKELDTKSLRVKFGIEAGITCDENDFDELVGEIESADFDFVLACAHSVDGADPFMPSLWGCSCTRS
jgi:histidinol-phosphatase (PHP family)